MSKARISEVKAKFSAFVARAKRGEVIEVMDRDTPVARLGPINEDNDDTIIIPASNPKGKLPTGIDFKAKIDVVALLREMRGDR